MINCTPLVVNETILFNRIVSEKKARHQGILTPICNQISTYYSQYLNNFVAVESKIRSEIPIADVLVKESLIKCYSSKTETFKYIYGRIFDIQPNELKSECPYCLIDEPETLDHYVSKNEFPEYSVLTRNLIPCCHSCNHKKGEIWRKHRMRRFIHFYNDQFISHRFLRARITKKRNTSTPTIEFYLTRSPEILDVEFRIIKRHFKYLKLLKRYSRRANSILSAEIDIVKKSLSAGLTLNQVGQILTDRFETLSESYGVNYWKAVVYETLESNKERLNQFN